MELDSQMALNLVRKDVLHCYALVGNIRLLLESLYWVIVLTQDYHEGNCANPLVSFRESLFCLSLLN